MVKSKTYTYIDGYNLINGIDNLIKIKNHSLEDARDKLINILSEYKHMTQEHVIVVFDAYNSDSVVENISKKLGIYIVYTKKHQTADSYIEKEIDKLAKKHFVKVVTNDNLIQQLVLERGGIRIPIVEFMRHIDSIHFKIQRFKKKDLDSNKNSFPLSGDIISKLDKVYEILEDEK